jgi:hypothetical protein
VAEIVRICDNGNSPRNGAARAGNPGLTYTFQPRSDVQAEPQSTRPDESHNRVALIRSIVNHATDDARTLDEIRAILAGASIDDLLLMRGVA